MKHLIFIVLICSLIACKKESKETTIANSEKGIEFHEVDNIKLSAGTLHRIDSFPSKYIVPRPIDVWLPEDYSKDKRYAVLYMHDGQMLFDSTTTWNKQEWKVDEWASKLMSEDKVKDFIVVAIWNIANLRNSNYFPEKVYKLMSQKDKDSLSAVGRHNNWINTIDSDNYLTFIVQDLKPYIDTNFSTLTDKENTVIMGSSRGGLISMYAISEYPEIFGSAACLSTHWIGTYSNENNTIPLAFFEYMKTNLPDSKTHQLYFDYGTKTLDEKYLIYQDQVSQILKNKGYITNIRFEDADHSENSWNHRLDQPLLFLLGK